MEKNLLGDIALDTFIEIFDSLVKKKSVKVNDIDKVISFAIGENKKAYCNLTADGFVRLNTVQKANISCLFLDVKHFFDFLKGKRRPFFVKGILSIKAITPIFDAVVDKFAAGINYSNANPDVILSLYKNAVVKKFSDFASVEVRVGNGELSKDITVTFATKDDMYHLFKGKLLFEFAKGSAIIINAKQENYNQVLNVIMSIGSKNFI